MCRKYKTQSFSSYVIFEMKVFFILSSLPTHWLGISCRWKKVMLQSFHLVSYFRLIDCTNKVSEKSKIMWQWSFENHQFTHTNLTDVYKGGVHILAKICPRSDPDIAHIKYSMDPLKLHLTELSAMWCIVTHYHSIPKGIRFWITWIFPC